MGKIEAPSTGVPCLLMTGADCPKSCPSYKKAESESLWEACTLKEIKERYELSNLDRKEEIVESARYEFFEEGNIEQCAKPVTFPSRTGHELREELYNRKRGRK